MSLLEHLTSLPQIERHEGIDVVRDDLLPGGTKVRFLVKMFAKYPEIVYASPACGGAQLALAHAAQFMGGRATIFVAKRKQQHARTIQAAAAGAQVFRVPHGYLSHVQSRARAYAADHGAHYLQFGADNFFSSCALEALAYHIEREHGPYDEVWSAAGSGVLTRGLQLGMPKARFRAVLVGRESNVGRAIPFRYPLAFDEEEQAPAPFPSCPNYDRKAWQVCRREHGPGRILFWNVLG